MTSDSLRFLTTALGLVVSLGVFGSPTKLLLPPAEVAAVSLQHEIATDTDTTAGSDSGSDDAEGDEEDGDSEEEGD
jgi:hypothetical protein